MNLAEFAQDIDRIDVFIALFVGFVVWLSVNSIGLRLLARSLSAETDEGKPRWAYATAQAGVRLLATLTGIAMGMFVLLLNVTKGGTL